MKFARCGCDSCTILSRYSASLSLSLSLSLPLSFSLRQTDLEINVDGTTNRDEFASQLIKRRISRFINRTTGNETSRR